LQANQTDIKGWIPNSVANSANLDISYDELQHITQAAMATEGTQDGEKILRKSISVPTSSITPATTSTATTSSTGTSSSSVSKNGEETQ